MTCPAPGCTFNAGHGVRHGKLGDTWTDLRPTTQKVELNVTYQCPLDCTGCNRGSFLQKPHTPDMTLDDVREFFRQADDLCWKPRITLIGGEPTLHPQFLEILDMCTAWSEHRVEIWSNAFAPRAKQLLKLARKKGAAIQKDTQKPMGARRGPRSETDYWVLDQCISPADFGITRDACFQHHSVICATAVGANGYGPCSLAGGIDALLNVGATTRTLADMFDREKVAALTEAACRHCGSQFMERDDKGHTTDVSHLPVRFGVRMSPTWVNAFQGRK